VSNDLILGNKRSHPYVPRVNSGGNFCGHQPDSPRFFIKPEKHANRPKILPRAQSAIQTYYRRPDTLPTLNSANGSSRQQRSERREACLILLACILHYTDLITLRVAIPQPNGTTAGLTMPYMAALGALGERRAERAIRDLKAAGIITVHPICEKLDNARYKGLAAIRTVSKELFAALGLGRWLAHERRRAGERHAQKIEKRRRKELANVKLAMNAAKPKGSFKNITHQTTHTGGLSSVADHLAGIRAVVGTRKKPPN